MIIIFSGYNQRAVIAFIRTLVKNNINDYAIIAASSEDTILKTAYASKVVYTRQHKELCLEEILTAISEIKQGKDGKCLLIPSTEALNRFFLLNRNVFEEQNCIIPLVCQEMYEMISDKKSFCCYCQKRGIDVPKEVVLDEANIPFVAKPKRYKSNDGKVYAPVIIQDTYEYNKFIASHNREDFIYQEYIWGDSLYLLYYFTKAGEIYKFSQINYAQQPFGKSIVVAACSDLHLDHSVSNVYEKIFSDMNYYGFVMIEVRHRKGSYYMIEANPRFWGPSQLFCNAGYNFFEIFLKEYGYLQDFSLDNINTDAKYMWSGGIVGELSCDCNCVWYANGRENVKREMEAYMSSDIYNREDTIEIYKKEKEDAELIKKLRELYLRESKHSNYQILTDELYKILGEDLKVNSRFEKERLKYITGNLDLQEKRILDIGGNTGFFTFESCNIGARSVDYYEGNVSHAYFVENAKKLLDMDDKIMVHPQYYLFEENEFKYDIVFCLNVVHHLGSDFGTETRMEEAKKLMIKGINQLAAVSKTLVFQMGFNWCGNPKICLFEKGTKEEMEDFIIEETKEYWDVLKIAVVEKVEEDIVYKDITEDNNVRVDSLGEFLNRPLFIMKSKLI